MSETGLRTLGLAVAFACAIYALLKRRELPALMFVVLGPLTYFSQNLGIVLTPGKLLGLLFLGYVTLKPRYLQYLLNKHCKRFFAYYLYGAFLTVFLSPLWPNYSHSVQGFLYGNAMRGPVQIFQVAMGLAIVTLTIHGIISVRSLHRIQVALLASMTLISIYGLYVWYAQNHGLPFNPITRQGGLNAAEGGRVIWAYVGAVREARAYSFTGEPKSLAVNACFGMVLVLFTAASINRKIASLQVQMILAPLFLITLYLTYSTAGYLIFLMLILAGLVSKLISGQLTKSLFGSFIVLFFVGVAIAYFNADFVQNKLTEAIDSRISSRLGNEGLFTYAEAAMTKHWLANPLSLVTGFGLGGSAFYVRLYDVESYSGFIAAPRGVIGFVADRGLIGLGLFTAALFLACQVIARAAISAHSNRAVYGGVLVICVVNFVLMMTYALWYVEWLTVGLACAGASIAERQLAAQRAPMREANVPLSVSAG